MLPQTPPFEALPLKKDGPNGNAWGLYGANDQLGMLNRLTPANTIAASKEIACGIRISTDWSLDRPRVPCYSRQAFRQEIKCKKEGTGNDDVLTFNTQGGSQWDGFRHYGYQKEKVFFNGCTQDEIETSKRNGIHIWVENGGIVGRGVLLDYAAWAESQGRELKPLETSSFTASDLKAVAKSQGVEFHPGDILFVRSGFVRAMSALSDSEAATFATTLPNTAIGIASSEETMRFLWEHEFSAVAGDAPAFEPQPWQSKEFWLHEWLLAGWGMPIGELFDLERLAETCREKGKWSFWFGSVPLKVPGGVASPPNGVAIL